MTVFGFKKQSNLTLFFAYTFMLLPIFCGLNWKTFLPFIAPISMVIAYFTMKAIKSNPIYIKKPSTKM